MKGRGSVLIRIAVLLGLLWILAPFLFGFTPLQAARWANPGNAPDILREWYMERIDASRISITRRDGTKTVISRSRYGESAAEYGADGQRVTKADGQRVAERQRTITDDP